MKELFKWDVKRYGVQVPAMDHEHEYLVGLMNKLYQLYQQNASRPALEQSLAELVKFAVKHFADEERYMEKTNFPQFKLHCAIHRQLVDQMTKYVAAFESSGKLTDEFFAFLKMWLCAHTTGIDVKYGDRDGQQVA